MKYIPSSQQAGKDSNRHRKIHWQIKKKKKGTGGKE